ncbi:GNAT family N-acetyltransferase [Streptococcus hyovaginalis]|uniref:GNAT family N-acetyltransferase n=1 Tax=Streptococcus hyovaginalis TaxID=149015 RepID=UPI003AEE85D6
MGSNLQLVDLYSWISNTKDKIEHFDCGNERINKEMRNLVTHPEVKRLLALVNETDKILGCMAYSLATTSLIQKGENPISRFPVLNIDLLGVAKNYQGNGYGTQLIVSALRMALTVNFLIPLHGVHLEALEEAVEFYERLGFEDLGNYYPGRQQTQMFFSIKSLEKTGITIYLDPYNLNG